MESKTRIKIIVVVLFVLLTFIAFKNQWLQVGSLGVITGSPGGIVDGDNTYRKAIKTMRSKGYAIMASFLEMMIVLQGHEHKGGLIIFAPSDEAVARVNLGFGELPPILLRHVVDTSSQLLGVEPIHTLLPGFVIELAWSDRDQSYMINSDVRLPMTTTLYEDGRNMIFVYGLSEIVPPLKYDTTKHSKRDTESHILTRNGND